MAHSTELERAGRDTEEFQAIIDRRRRNRMDAMDSMPADMRALVHDYGWNIVTAFREAGVTKVNRIRHLVEAVLDEFSPTRGANSMQGPHRAPGITAAQIARMED